MQNSLIVASTHILINLYECLKHRELSFALLFYVTQEKNSVSDPEMNLKLSIHLALKY